MTLPENCTKRFVQLELALVRTNELTTSIGFQLMLRNETTKTLTVENIYKESDEATHNVQVFAAAPDLASARPHLQKVLLHPSFV